MADDCRCQNCGNAGRFTVMVTHPRVTGQWCRNACSRMCAHILAEHGRNEMRMISGTSYDATYEIRPQFTPTV